MGDIIRVKRGDNEVSYSDIPEPLEAEINNHAESDPGACAAGMGIVAFFSLCALVFALFIKFCMWLFEQYKTYRYWKEIHAEQSGYRYQIDGHLRSRADEPHVIWRKTYCFNEKPSVKMPTMGGTGERGRWFYQV